MKVVEVVRFDDDVKGRGKVRRWLLFPESVYRKDYTEELGEGRMFENSNVALILYIGSIL